MPVSPARSLAQRAAWLHYARNSATSSIGSLSATAHSTRRPRSHRVPECRGPLLPTEAALGSDDESSVFGLLERHGAADAADFLRTAVARLRPRGEVDEDGSVQILSTSDGLYSVVWRSVARRDDNRTAFTVSGTRLEWLRSVFRGEPAAFEPSLSRCSLDTMPSARRAQAAEFSPRIPRIPPSLAARGRGGRGGGRGNGVAAQPPTVAARRVDLAPRSPTPTRCLAGSARLRRTPTRCAAGRRTRSCYSTSVWPREMLAMSHRLERTPLARAAPPPRS